MLAELNRCGNFQSGEHIPCNTYGKRREQTKAVVGDAVKQVMAVPVRSRKPLVIERLEFAKKKAALENGGSGVPACFRALPTGKRFSRCERRRFGRVATSVFLALVGLGMAYSWFRYGVPGILTPKTEKETAMTQRVTTGIIDKASTHSVDQTVEKLKKILQSQGVTLFALVDRRRS